MDSDPSIRTVGPSWESDTIPVPVGWELDSGWSRRLVRFEALVGLAATLSLGFAPVIPLSVLTLSLLNSEHYFWAMAVAGGMLLAAGLAAWVAAVASNAVRTCFPEWSDDPATRLRLKPDEFEHGSYVYPFAIEMALSMPPFPLPLRPVLGLWWMLHFAAGLCVGIGAHSWVDALFSNPLLELLCVVSCHAAFVLSANLYLIMAVSAVRPNDLLLMRMWNARFFIDFMLSAAVLLYYLGH